MDYQAVSDPALIRLVREGDPQAFAELSARYLGLIRGKAQLFQGPAAPEWDDMLQEGLLGLYVAAVTYSEEGGASFATYAGVCVHNRIASALRKHRSVKNRPLNESVSLENAHELTAEAGPEDLVEAGERLQRLLQQMNTALTPLERKALSLYLGGCRRSEVPEKGNISLRTFDNAMYRVRGKLKSLGWG